MVPSVARAQGTILVLETTFDGEIAGSVKERFDQAVVEGLGISPDHQIVGPTEARLRLGPDADRLMTCGSDASCLRDIGAVTVADGAAVATVSEAGEIYTFTIDVYELSEGQGVYFGDSDCALCTVDEAVAALDDLAREAAAALPGPAGAAEAAAPETVSLFVRVTPEEAAVAIDGEALGTGWVDHAVEPGEHLLRVELEGYRTVEETIAVAPGDEDKQITVNLRPLDAGGPEAVERSGGALAGIDTTALGSVFVGAGLASVVAGIVLIAIDGDITCSDSTVEACPEVFNTAGGGVVLTVLGGASLGAGAIFLLWDKLAGTPPGDADGESADDLAGFDLRAGPAGAFVTFSTAF
jgi:hypothetical protein